jgi:hypothetical protein
MDESNRMCGDLAADAERRFQALLAGRFRRAARAGEVDLRALGLGATEVAELLTRTVAGLKGPGVTVETYRKRLAALMRVFVAGLAGGARRARATAAHP